MQFCALGIAAVCVAAVLAGCNAKVKVVEGEEGCVGGDGTCDDTLGLATVSTTSTGPGGGGGGAGGGQMCPQDCSKVPVTPGTGQYPCAVEAVMAFVCRDCHSADKLALTSAPWPWDTYEESRQEYLKGSPDSGPRSCRVWNAIFTDFMPLGPKKLDADQKKTMIDWSCSGGPPRMAEEMCQ